MTPPQVIQLLDTQLATLRGLWLAAVDPVARELARAGLDTLLDQRLVLMRHRDSTQPVLCIVLTPL